MSCTIFRSCQPVKWHTVWVLLITVLADEHVTILGRKKHYLGTPQCGGTRKSHHFFSAFRSCRRSLWTKLNQEVWALLITADRLWEATVLSKTQSLMLQSQKYTCKTNSIIRTLSHILFWVKHSQLNRLLSRMPGTPPNAATGSSPLVIAL